MDCSSLRRGQLIGFHNVLEMHGIFRISTYSRHVIITPLNNRTTTLFLDGKHFLERFDGTTLPQDHFPY